MIRLLARGHFCPKDHQQHLALAALQPQIAVAYTQIVTISTDNIVETREFRASVGARWTFLWDAGPRTALTGAGSQSGALFRRRALSASRRFASPRRTRAAR